MLGRWLDWFGDHRLGLLAALLLCVAGSWCFIAVADEVFEGDTKTFDDWMITVLRDSDDLADPIGPPWLEEIGRDLTALGGVVVLTLMCLAIAGFLWLSRKRREVCLLAVATLGGVVIASILKVSFDRPRPDLVPHLSHVESSSFPSGHSMMSAIVYLTLGTVAAEVVTTKRLKFYCLAVAITIVLLVGVSRVYLGVHYPTDVLAGWSAGLVWAIFCWSAMRLLRGSSPDTNRIR
jgi:undecaprenyl-diphosphatase